MPALALVLALYLALVLLPAALTHEVLLACRYCLRNPLTLVRALVRALALALALALVLDLLSRSGHCNFDLRIRWPGEMCMGNPRLRV